MNFEKEKADMLAENMRGFIQYVQLSYQLNNSHLSNPDKLYRLKLLLQEFQFRIIADEVLRINRFIFDEKYTAILVNVLERVFKLSGNLLKIIIMICIFLPQDCIP